MKRIALITVTFALLANTQAAEEKLQLTQPKDKVSYSLGMNIGNTYKRQGLQPGVDVELAPLFQGIKDALTGTNFLITEAEGREVMMAFQKDLRAKQEQRRKEAGEKGKKDGEAFLAQNKTKPGVVTLPSGLQYKVLKDGQGASPKSNDVVTVHYRGKLLDGTEFDSSYQRGQPATFGVGGVIKGWTEALQIMKPGAKWELFVPSGLAYGESGRGATIPPNTLLNFEVELLSVKSTNEPITSDIIKVPSAEELKKGAKIEVIKPGDLPKK